METNKRTFKGSNFNLHIFHENMMYEDSLGLMFASTNNKIHPPISKDELKNLADFIYDYLDNNSEYLKSDVDNGR